MIVKCDKKIVVEMRRNDKLEYRLTKVEGIGTGIDTKEFDPNNEYEYTILI